jgi:hypothetical protein
MSLNIIKYLRQLRCKAIQYERTDINGVVSDSFFTRNARRIYCSVISLVLVYLLRQGFSDAFISYTSTILSILIGLFITAMIFSFDKFYQKIDTKTATAKEKLRDTQAYNYSKQFAYITGYNIVLSIFTLVILSLSTLFDELMRKNIFLYQFDINNINQTTLLNFFIMCFVLIQRFLVLYWLTSVMYNTLFLVSSMVQFMIIKIEKDND